jgi:8-oxo-dGTP pyrophosphatase MutT (NUDIX family)
MPIPMPKTGLSGWPDRTTARGGERFMIPIDNIRRQLATYTPSISDTKYEDTEVRASVAIVLNSIDGDCEMLLIRRSEHEGDVWSGDIAFPGGRVDSADEPPRVAAERETLEEVGIDLAAADYVGRLDDLSGRTHAVLVSAFVYATHGRPSTELNHEVADTRWMPLAEIVGADAQVWREFEYRGGKIELPGIRVFDDDTAPILWGLTYRFLEVFMRVVGRPIPNMPWRSDL